MCLLSSAFVTVLANEFMGKKKKQMEKVYIVIFVFKYFMCENQGAQFGNIQSHSKHDFRVTCTENC